MDTPGLATVEEEVAAITAGAKVGTPAGVAALVLPATAMPAALLRLEM